jgi:hypothetical protein
MTVRPATEADVPVLIEMGCRFIASSRYAGLMAAVPAQQAQLTATLLAQGGCWVLEGPEGVVGMLGLVLAPLPMTGELAALECMWWVEPGWRHGASALQMWEEGEAWARNQGATCIQMIQPVGQEALGVLYRRRGYVAVETTWQKPLAA